ncbi:MAG: 3-hydroxyacyl-CoA dehydrogenase [Caldisphaera sp.]
MNIKKIGIVGSGTMGRGIAQLFSSIGKDIYISDISLDLVEKAISSIKANFQKLFDKGKISEEQVKDFISHLHVTKEIEELSGCDLIIEAIPENINLKKDFFQNIEKIVDSNCILATNTSSLSVTEIASVCQKPERVAGLHFFNPVPLMKIVEIVKGMRTDEQVCEKLTDLIKDTGHTPIVTIDVPGFVVNHAGRAYVTESLTILEETIAKPHEIDLILKESFGFKMGPFELIDLTGVDVTHPVTESIYNQFYQDQKYRPSYLLRLRMFAKLLGRKTGEGFYSYNDNQLVNKNIGKNQDMIMPKLEVPIWVSQANKNGYEKVVSLIKKSSITLENMPLPSEKALCIVTPLGYDATTTILKENLDPTRTIAVDTLLDINKHITLMGSPVLDNNYKTFAFSFFKQVAGNATFISDSPGFVAQRVLAMIVNIGCTIAQKGIATPKDIDIAVKLGLGYPMGPLEMGDYIGTEKILSILENLYDTYKDPRYRPSLWLKRRAELGVSLFYI